MKAKFWLAAKKLYNIAAKFWLDTEKLYHMGLCEEGF